MNDVLNEQSVILMERLPDQRPNVVALVESG